MFIGGGSPQAKSDINLLKIDNVDGLVESSDMFWRVSDKISPHNVVTTTENILSIANRKGYRIISHEDSVLNYAQDEVELKNGIDATKITLPYSSSYQVIYEYDTKSKRYIRICDEDVQKDWITDELITTKNIIVTYARNYDLEDGSGKGRQELSNLGTLDGYYITNGKAIEIKCYKSSRTEKTIYRDLSGKEIDVNDGNTFIQIVPMGNNITIEPGELDKTESTIKNTNAIG